MNLLNSFIEKKTFNTAMFLVTKYLFSFNFRQLFRHGPRTPVTTYPTDPYINETFMPYGWGALTNVSTHQI